MGPDTARRPDSGTKPFDAASVRVLTNSGCGEGGAFTLASGRLPAGFRWFVAQVDPLKERLACDWLEHLGFPAFLPLIAREVRHARRVEVKERPLLPGYVFLGFEPEGQAWRRAYRVGLGLDIQGPTPERPSPLPRGLAEQWLAEGWDKPLTRDLLPDLIAAGAEVDVTDGPFCDHRGVCLWDDGKRVRVLLSLLGREVPATLPRAQVARA